MLTAMLAQARALMSFLLLLYLIPVLCLSAVVVASTNTGISLGDFLRDPSSTTETSPFVGVISNLGALLWAASATVCLFSWSIMRSTQGKTAFARFVLFFGLMTVILLLDDLFLFHETVYPRFGVSEMLSAMCYGVVVLYGLIAFRKCILETEFLILLIALAFFGLSIFVDTFQGRIEWRIGEWRILAEDGAKFLGIVAWFGYFSRCCFLRINST